MAGAPLLSAEAVSCGGLHGVNLSIGAKTLNLLVGAPGCGKGLLLRALGLLEAPDAGEIVHRGRPTRTLPEPERAALRNRHFGFLFAEAYLLPSFSVVENVAMPFFKISSVDTGEAHARTRALLDFVNLGPREQAAVQDLSRAEQRRAALARALVNLPDIVFVEAGAGEEPDFGETLRRAAAEFGAAFVVSAEGEELAAVADRCFEVTGGAVRPLVRV